MSDDLERPPRLPLGIVLVGVAVLALALWIGWGVVAGFARFVVSLVGYVVVAFVAYRIGKLAGRHSRDDR